MDCIYPVKTQADALLNCPFPNFSKTRVICLHFKNIIMLHQLCFHYLTCDDKKNIYQTYWDKSIIR